MTRPDAGGDLLEADSRAPRRSRWPLGYDHAVRRALSGTSRRIARLASTDDAPHHQAFLDEIAASGAPTDLRGELRAARQHAIAARDVREPNALSVASSGLLVAVGMIAYLTAPEPRIPRYGYSTASAASTALHLAGVVGLIATLLLSPRSIRKRTFVAITVLPTLGGALGSAIFPGQSFHGVAVYASAMTRAADVPVIFGCLALLVGCTSRDGHARVFRIGWWVFAAGCFAAACSQILWAIEFALHDDVHWFLGSVFAGAGLVLLSGSMARFVPLLRDGASSARHEHAPAAT